MRPKPWARFDSGKAFWKTEAEFETAVKRAEAFRANEVIKEQLRSRMETNAPVL